MGFELGDSHARDDGGAAAPAALQGLRDCARAGGMRAAKRAASGRRLAHVGLPSAPNYERFCGPDRRVRPASRVGPMSARGLGRCRGCSARLAPLIAEFEQAGALAGRREPPAQAGSPQR